MKVIELTGPIENFTADVLACSTNQHLNLSGGVGACLVRKFGDDIQRHLDAYLTRSQLSSVAVGTIIETKTPFLPWKKIFHTVATDLEYTTNPETVTRIIDEILERCELDHSVNRIVFSALGTGYGSLKYSEFLEILNQALKNYSKETFCVFVVKNQEE